MTNGPDPYEETGLSGILGEASNFQFEGDNLTAEINLHLPFLTEKLSFAVCGIGDLLLGGSPFSESPNDATVIDFELKSVSCLSPEENSFCHIEKDCRACEFDTNGDGDCANSKNCLENEKAFWMAKTTYPPGKIYDPGTGEFIENTEENRKKILDDFEKLVRDYVKACPSKPKKENS